MPHFTIEYSANLDRHADMAEVVEVVRKAAAETGIPLSSYCSVARGKVFENPLFGEIGTAYGKSAGQVVLRWILQKGVSLNTMSTRPENIRTNFDVMDFTLSSIDMAKIEAGHVDLHEAVFHPAEIGEEVVRMLRQSVAAARVRVDVHLPPELPCIRADEQQLRRVLVNLLSNAIKFSPRGAAVTLAARSEGERIVVCVKDMGRGIPKAFQPRIFNRFEQARETDATEKAGSGLGLAIARELVTLMQGRIGFSSEEGIGTTFWVSLPAERKVE